MKTSKAYSQLLTAIISFFLGMQALAQGTYVKVLTEDERYYSNYASPIAGYDFVPHSSITVGALGVYDHHFDGLYGDNVVGLWARSSGALLAQATVGGGNTGVLMQGYRWVEISPISLTAGETYTIASCNAVYEAIGALSRGTHAASGWVSLGAGYIDDGTTGLRMPTRQGGEGRVFIGPGFASGIPEPSSPHLMILAVTLIYLYRSKRHLRGVSRRLRMDAN